MAESALANAAGREAHGNDRIRVRDGSNPLELRAIERVQTDIGRFTPSLVVQLAFGTNQVAEWADAAGVRSLVYNMLAFRRPYRRVRQLLAEALRVAPIWVDHLIEAQLGTSGGEPVLRDVPGAPPWTRDGGNPIERLARERVETDIASMSASLVVQLCIWPRSLKTWAHEIGIKWEESVYDALGNAESEPDVRSRCALSLGVPLRTLEHLIEDRPAKPRVGPPWQPGRVAAPTTGAMPASRPRLRKLAPPPRDQTILPL